MAAAKETKDPKFESGLDLLFFVFWRMCQTFLAIFCANSTYALKHASNLRNFAKTYNGRKLNAHSAHVALLCRCCVL